MDKFNELFVLGEPNPQPLRLHTNGPRINHPYDRSEKRHCYFIWIPNILLGYPMIGIFRKCVLDKVSHYYDLVIYYLSMDFIINTIHVFK